MRVQDVKVGEEYAASRFQDSYTPDRVRVLEVGLERETFNRKVLKDGVRVERLDETGEVIPVRYAGDDVIPARWFYEPWADWSEKDRRRRESVEYHRQRQEEHAVKVADVVARLNARCGTRIYAGPGGVTVSLPDLELILAVVERG